MDFLVKAAGMKKRTLKVHKALGVRPQCGVGKGESVSWQIEIGPANCKRCLRSKGSV